MKEVDQKLLMETRMLDASLVNAGMHMQNVTNTQEAKVYIQQVATRCVIVVLSNGFTLPAAAPTDVDSFLENIDEEEGG